MKKVLSILSILVFIYACTDDEGMTTPDDGNSTGSVNTFDRSAMLTNWSDNIIIPGYVDFANKVDALETVAEAFTSEPSDLTDIRSKWLDAYTVWQRVSMFEIGPAENVDFRLSVNIYPSDVAAIEENIASGLYDLELSSNRVAKGFPALDYLLFGLGDTDAAILEKYTGPNGVSYRTYLMDVIADINERTSLVLAAWQGDYRDVFVANNGASSTASTDRFVNDYIFYFERHLRAGKMGIPGGVFSGTTEPNTIEGLYNGSVSKQLFIEGLDAMQDFFNGKAYTSNTTGESLNSYLDELNVVKDGADLSAIINNQFDTSRTAVQGLGNFKTELEVMPPVTFLDAYSEVQRLVPLFKVDMVSALSISIDFADADGD